MLVYSLVKLLSELPEFHDIAFYADFFPKSVEGVVIQLVRMEGENHVPQDDNISIAAVNFLSRSKDKLRAMDKANRVYNYLHKIVHKDIEKFNIDDLVIDKIRLEYIELETQPTLLTMFEEDDFYTSYFICNLMVIRGED